MKLIVRKYLRNPRDTRKIDSFYQENITKGEIAGLSRQREHPRINDSNLKSSSTFFEFSDHLHDNRYTLAKCYAICLVATEVVGCIDAMAAICTFAIAHTCSSQVSD